MTVEEYINQQTPEQQRILRWLRQLLLTADTNLREKIGWNVPVYTYHQANICYLNVVRSQPPTIDLAFMQGSQLPDEAGWLESRGRKTVKSLVVRAVGEPDEDTVRTYIQEALLLNSNRHL